MVARIAWKLVKWFAMQIRWVVSLWWALLLKGVLKGVLKQSVHNLFCQQDTSITCFTPSTDIFNIYGLFGIFHVILFCTLVCSNLVAKCFGRFACFDLGSPFIDAVPLSVQELLTIFCWLGRHVFLKMPVNLIQYRGTVGIFNTQHFVVDLKHNIQALLIHSRSHVFHIMLASFVTVFFYSYFSQCSWY